MEIKANINVEMKEEKSDRNNNDKIQRKNTIEKNNVEKTNVDDMPIEQQLFHYAKTGDAEGIKRIHKQVNINVRDQGYKEGQYPTHNTALHYACQYGHLNVVKMLFSLEAQIESTNKLLSTPLHIASANGKEDIVKFLIDSKADLRAENKIGNIPLHCAIYIGHLPTVKILLEAENDPKTALKTNNAALMTPVRYCPRENMELRKYLAQWFKGQNKNKISEEEEKMVKDLQDEEEEEAKESNAPDYPAPMSNKHNNY
jgi:hypothetical protein